MITPLFSNDDLDFLKSVGVSSRSTHDDEPLPEILSSPIFSPDDMQRRFERLKAENRLPKLADVLRVLAKHLRESEGG